LLSPNYIININEDFESVRTSGALTADWFGISREEAEARVDEFKKLHHVISVDFDDEFFASDEEGNKFSKIAFVDENVSDDKLTDLAYRDAAIRFAQDIPGFVYQDVMTKRGNMDRLIGTIKDHMDDNMGLAKKLSDWLGLKPYFGCHDRNKYSYSSYHDYHLANSYHTEYARLLYWCYVRTFDFHALDAINARLESFDALAAEITDDCAKNSFSRPSIEDERELAEAEVARLGGHLEIDEEYFDARSREPIYFSPADVRAETMAEIEEMQSIYHLTDIEIDESYFAEEAIRRNTETLYRTEFLNYAEADAILIDGAVYNSFLENLNDFMFAVYLNNLKLNHSDGFTDIHAQYLDANEGAFSFALELESVRKTFSAMGFFAGDNFVW
jgi:hypothetical protein